MNKYRLIFEKTQRAVYISHLDLMRVLRRAFKRAEIDLRHSEGFNPHPVMSLALPLSLGQESICELLDFETVLPCDTRVLPEKLNAVLPEGIRVSGAVIAGRKFSQIKWIDVECEFYYDDNFSDITRLGEIFKRESLIITKKTKRGETELDLAACIRDVRFTYSAGIIVMRALVSAFEPSVNPALLLEVISPKPDFSVFRRTGLRGGDMKSFIQY